VNLSFPVEPRKVKDIQARPFPDLAAGLQAVLKISDIRAATARAIRFRAENSTRP
jgi:hypothetical protein